MVATFFVGSLFGVGLFLSFYKGSSRQDRILAVIWGLAAIFIGLIPMNPCNDPDLPNLCVDPGHTTYHFVPVAVFFAINIYMAVLKAAADTALQRFRDAVARHAEEQRRREKREWVIATAPVKLPYDLPLAERDAALAAARRAVDQHPEHADRRELEAARDRALEPFVTAHERRTQAEKSAQDRRSRAEARVDALLDECVRAAVAIEERNGLELDGPIDRVDFIWEIKGAIRPALVSWAARIK